MRILSLTLKNLNSLKGEWHIDFTNPAYQDSGIFAITGQTGAGKTTILDAICLALYGETPRISNISGASNEVMTRQTGDCYAEVVILVNNKYYRCHWSQRRAYNKAEGKLQAAEHELSELMSLHDAQQGNIIESKLSRTRLKIQTITGMDFQQFTRSILLAQGRFSAFLKANASERADILEKITGTDIYAEISKRVHDKKRSNEQKLKELTASLSGIELLSEQTIQQINTAMSAQLAKQQQLTNQQTKLNEQISWQKSITNLTVDITAQKSKLVNAKQALSNFADDDKRLTRATKALEIDSDYQQLAHTRQLQTDYISKQTQLKLQLKKEQVNLTQANDHLKTANETLMLASEQLKQQLPLIAQVRSLDNELNTQQNRLTDNQSHHQQLNQTLTQQKQSIASHQSDIQQTQNQLSQINHYLQTHSHHANLANERDNLYKSCQEIKKLLLANAQTESMRAKHIAQGSKLSKQQQALNQTLEQTRDKISDNQQVLAQLQQRSHTLLAGKTINEWRADLSHFNNQHHQLGNLNDQHTQLINWQQNQQQLQQTHQQLSVKKEQTNTQIIAQKNTLNQLKNTLVDKTDKLALHQQVIKLEQYIINLQANEPCPLCGATEHPYLSDLNSGSHPHVALTNNATNQLNKLQNTIDKLNQQIANKQDTLNQVERDQVSITTKIAEINKQIETISHQSQSLKKSIEQQLTQFSKNNIGNELNQAIIHLQADNQACTLTCQNVIKDYEQLEEQLKQNKQYDEQLTTQLNQTQKHYDDLVNEQKLYQQKLTHFDDTITNNFASLTHQITQLNAVLKRQKASLPISLEAMINPDLKKAQVKAQVLAQAQIEPLLNQLRTIFTDWKIWEQTYTQNSTQKIELEKQISSTSSTLTELLKQQTQTQQAFDELDTHLKRQQNEYQTCLSNRQTLFADKNPDAEEQRLRQEQEQALQAVNSNKQQQQNYQHNVDTLSTTLTELLQTVTGNQNKLDTQIKAFNTLLDKHGFTTIDDFVSARLTQLERKQLTEQKQGLTGEVTRLQALIDSNEQALATQTAKKLTDTPLTDLQKQLADTQQTANSLAKQIGIYTQQLNDNKTKQAKIGKQQQAIDKQRADGQVLEQLHKLIGSSDGQKFRNFAQGLTFDFMIKGANKQLQKMSDRYLLIRDDNEPLELNVIDNYQAGEVRSCKNLSGGESFIISLALALGLSQMASQNVSVDSLFLDEGFGTLDDDSLDIALDTLTSLQQEGKLIGVISHVQALKDRIATQIKVEKISGGVSKISGVGVSRG